MGLAGACNERRNQADSSLAVEGAAALLEQRGLLDEGWVAVLLQQLTLDLGHPRRARHALLLFGEHAVVLVEVAEVVRGNRAELLEHRAWLSRLLGELVAVVGEELGQHVASVDLHSTYPGQMVQPDLVDEHSRGRDVEQPRDQPLHADRDVAEPHRAMPRIA